MAAAPGYGAGAAIGPVPAKSSWQPALADTTPVTAPPPIVGPVDSSSVYQFTLNSITGQRVSLSSFRWRKILIVNPASYCSYTPQYTDLQTLNSRYGSSVVVLGFPCNQFGAQEPGDTEQIGAFCQRNYGVSFPMMAKVDVNGAEAHPIFKWLKDQKGGLLTDGIKWNFTKFLIGSDGQVIDRYAPTTKPEAIKKDIEKALTAAK